MPAEPDLRCYYHPERVAADQCDRCGDMLCSACVVELHGRPLCSGCKIETSPDARDKEHLKLLSIFHYVMAALTVVGSCFPLMYVFIGYAFLPGGSLQQQMQQQRRQQQEMQQQQQEQWEQQQQQQEPGQPPLPQPPQLPPMPVPQIPRGVGEMFIAMGIGGALILWTLAGLILAAGLSIHKRKRRMFCIVIAAITCAFFPLGTALGVLSILVLARDSVRRMFDEAVVI